MNAAETVDARDSMAWPDWWQNWFAAGGDVGDSAIEKENHEEKERES